MYKRVLTPLLSPALQPPRSVAEALQQRMDRYKAAAEGAKSKGDDRKARMHQRIVKVTQRSLGPKTPEFRPPLLLTAVLAAVKQRHSSLVSASSLL